MAAANIPTLLSVNVAARTIPITTAAYDDVCSAPPRTRPDGQCTVKAEMTPIPIGTAVLDSLRPARARLEIQSGHISG